MKTIFSVVVLVILGFAANFIGTIILNIAGTPGAVISGNPATRSKLKYTTGLILSVIGQSYIYLAYVGFIVNWTRLAITIQKVSFIIWPIAFLTTVLPIWLIAIRARFEAKENGKFNEKSFFNVQIEALSLTLLIAFLGFFIFLMIPNLLTVFYRWVPYIK